jgi:molybdopterin-containing oxidoreductase family iron-sulfur binding subunit
MAPDADTQPELWQTIDQWMDSPEFRRVMQDEFPEDAPEWLDPVSRRHFLTLMGASLALAGVTGCNPSFKPASQRKAVPYVKKPEGLSPGVPLFFPTAFSLGGLGLGVIVRSNEGRPTKVEGNPSHPGSLGATDIYAQGALLNLYDPERSRQVLRGGNEPTSWEKLRAALAGVMEAQKAKRGAGLRVLTEPTSSPTLAALMGELKAQLPEAKWVQFDPVNRDNAHRGARLAFGRYVTPLYKLDAADVLLFLEADTFGSGPAGVRMAHDAAKRRKVRVGEHKKPQDGVSPDRLNRVYAVESMPTTAGAVADHRLPLKPSEIESFVRELAKELGVAGSPPAGPLPDLARQWVKPLADDLRRANGNASVVPGDTLSPAAHALVHAINQKLGAFGKTVTFADPILAEMTGPGADAVADMTGSLKALVEEMKAGKVDALLILGGNPAFTAPADLEFAKTLDELRKAHDEKRKAEPDAARKRAFATVHLGQYHDETAWLCDWHVNEAHYLETWGDVRAYDGTVTVQQPLIAPFTGGKSVLEVLATLLDKQPQDPRLLVRATWEKHFADRKLSGDFDTFWHTALERGVVEGTAAAAVQVGDVTLADEVRNAPAPAGGGREVAFRQDPTLYDGRFANNGWLQELPKPITKLTWDNAAIVSPGTAEALGIVHHLDGGLIQGNYRYTWRGGEHGQLETDKIEIAVGNRRVKAAVFILPGHADDVITLHVGYGRERAGKIGTGTGFNAYAIRTTAGLWSAPVADARRVGERYTLSCTQGQYSMQGRRPARWGTAEQVRAELRSPEFTGHHKHVFDFANNPPVAAAERDLIHQLVPGTADERERNIGKGWIKRGPHDHAHHDEPKTAAADGKKDHHHEHDKRMVPLTLYDKNLPVPHSVQYRRWGMAIDLGACIGCSACVIACVSENNTPVVGKDQVNRGRAMHWLRIDRYFAVPGEAGGTKKVEPSDRWAALKGNPAGVGVYVQPLMCVQCEKAPCEVVCPVGATVHSAEGLNDMVYNRCVGTRYCSNNCPYKVRRFNFLQYADYASDSTLKLVNNPEVTVRTRGVMEKCTYCVQRIRNAEIEAEREHDNPARPKVRMPDDSIRPAILDGEIKTACQAACPTYAITFGDLNYSRYQPVKKAANGRYEDAGEQFDESEVARWKLEPSSYGLLAELNTMPRTSYLAAVRNPNPVIENLLRQRGA